jgi:glycosyltransferase involved in cell wall biosynthesis
MRQGISVFFPCYNDWATIASQVILAARTVSALTDDWEVVVVNDASADHSAAVLEELVKQVPNFRVVTHPKNRGYGGALRSGFAASTKEWIFYTDGDAQYDVAELPRLWEARDGVDLVNGFKISRSDPFHRIVVGRVYHWIVKWAFWLESPDVDCDFRLIHRRVFETIELTRDTGLICVELVANVEKNGFGVRHVPVRHYPRFHGKSQFFNFRRVAEVILGLYRLWWELVVRRRLRR